MQKPVAFDNGTAPAILIAESAAKRKIAAAQLQRLDYPNRQPTKAMTNHCTSRATFHAPGCFTK